MTIELVTHYDHRRQAVGSVSSEQFKRYCARHGYSYHQSNSSLLAENPYFSKVKLLRERLQHVDYVLWVDADCVFTDESESGKIEDLIKYILPQHCNMLISQDRSGICTGVFLLKNTVWSHRMLEAWDFLGLIDKHDQNTLKTMMQSPQVSQKVGLIPESVVSNRNSPGGIGTFIHHFWATASDNQEATAVAMAAMAEHYSKQSRL